MQVVDEPCEKEGPQEEEKVAEPKGLEHTGSNIQHIIDFSCIDVDFTLQRM